MPETTLEILEKGLNAMTLACEALTKQNDVLNKDIEGLKNEASRLEEKIIINKE